MLPYSPSPLFGVLAMAFIVRAAAQAVYAPVIVSCIRPENVNKLSPSPYSVPASDLNGGLDPAACANACRAAGYLYSLLLNVDYAGGPLDPAQCKCINAPVPHDYIVNGDGSTGSCKGAQFGYDVYTVYDTSTTFRFDFCSLVYPGADAPIDLYGDEPYWPEPTAVKTASVAGPEQCFSFCSTNAYTAFRPDQFAGALYTCWCFDDISVINSPDELDDCLFYNAYYYRNTAVTSASNVVRRRRRLTDAFSANREKLALCPPGLSACNVHGTRTFECIDTKTELESCGGCVSGAFGHSNGSGENCATLPGVKMGGTTCSNGRCEVFACRRGFTLVDGAAANFLTGSKVSDLYRVRPSPGNLDSISRAKSSMADVMMAESSTSALTRRQHLANTFDAYRAGLDADNERREKLVIISRATTQLSKKLIFHLHRGATSSPAQRAKNLSEARKKQAEILSNFVKIRAELKTGEEEWESFWKWSKPVAPGMEEYIEAISFLHYLDHGNLISLKEIQDHLTDRESSMPYVHITGEDYILGMSDLTGELMRYATNALSTGDHHTPLAVCDFVRTVKARFDNIPAHMLSSYMQKKLASKQEETTRSLLKIEKVCYSLRLRLIEYADRPDILAQMASRALDDAEGGGVEEI